MEIDHKLDDENGGWMMFNLDPKKNDVDGG